MKLINRWTRAAEATEFLVGNYEKLNLSEFRAGLLYGQLNAIGPNPHPDEVDEIMGDDSLTQVGLCKCCKQEAEEVVELWTGSIVCAKCLLAAMQLIEP